MSDECETEEAVPEGFKPVPAGLGFSDVVQPSYIRVRGDDVSFGMLARANHGNSLGIVHGGVIMTLADLAASCGVSVAKGIAGGTPTINLSVDFVSAGRLGQWLQADVQQVSLKRRFAFSSGIISNSAGIVARFNGTFYLPDHDGLHKDGKTRQSVMSNLQT